MYSYIAILCDAYLVSCPSLTDPVNGIISCSLGDDGVLSFRDTCNFICNTGYELVGGNLSICQSDGSWSRFNATCDKGSYSTYY